MCLVLLFAVAACGDSGAHAGSMAAADVGKLTVTNSACIYEGSSTHVAGAVTILLVDQTGGGFNLHMWVLDSSYPYADLAREFLSDHGTLRAHAQMTDSASVKPGATQRFTTHFYAGTYAFHCVPLRDGSEYGVGYTAGPIRVT